MNIRDFWPTDQEVPSAPTTENLQALLAGRKEVFQGFAAIESSRGFLRPEMPLQSSQGQEGLRVLFARSIEEILEAIHSDAEDHFLEELIDSVNFQLSMAILDPQFPTEHLAKVWAHRAEGGVYGLGRLGVHTYLKEFMMNMHPVLESLRNRAWQNNPQSLYFDGYLRLAQALSYSMTTVSRFFPDYHTFMLYYEAKDRVLRFRLRSSY